MPMFRLSTSQFMSAMKISIILPNAHHMLCMELKNENDSPLVGM